MEKADRVIWEANLFFLSLSLTLLSGSITNCKLKQGILPLSSLSSWCFLTHLCEIGCAVDMVECGHQGLPAAHSRTQTNTWTPYSHKHRHFNWGAITHPTTGGVESSSWEWWRAFLCCLHWFPLSQSLSLTLSVCLQCYYLPEFQSKQLVHAHLNVSKAFKS